VKKFFLFQVFIRKTGKHFVFQENEKFEYTFMLGIGYKKEYQKKFKKQLLNELFYASRREKISKKRVHNELKSGELEEILYSSTASFV
jgi:hypothetical protein